jgi:CheY-like chemotaxis protein
VAQRAIEFLSEEVIHMENIGQILQGLASLAWPVIVIIILFAFRSSVKALLESARARKFTIKVAGNELTMEEASEQQRALISDLQKQIVDIQKSIEAVRGTQPVSEAVAEERKAAAANAILWVDDKPKNNAFLIENLTEQGINVTTALSTAEALAMFTSRKFDRIISDMGRYEEGRFSPVAGLELTRQIRAVDRNIPIVIYTSIRSAQEQRQAAIDSGVTEITASPTVLLNALQMGSQQ